MLKELFDRRSIRRYEDRPVEPEKLTELLRAAGFTHIQQYGDRKLRHPKPGEGRIFFAARKEF